MAHFWTTAFGKGILDESAPNVRNIYSGGFGHAGEKRYLDSCDLVTEVTVAFSAATVQIDGETFQDLPAKHLLSKLLGRLNGSRLPEGPSLARLKSRPGGVVDTRAQIRRHYHHPEALHARLQHLLNPGDIILGETGTAAYGVRNLTLPQHGRFFSPVTWLSIGYMPPAALGAGLAQRKKILQGDFHGIGHARTVLFIGDGSVQISVPEISTIILKSST
ncbi:hypothetical protein NW754_001352 [Fusarium falciforme]|nr:hypothetical protein NW754_001352 [Fusarium falciforme]